jgi:hypothetical protein
MEAQREEDTQMEELTQEKIAEASRKKCSFV